MYIANVEHILSPSMPNASYRSQRRHPRLPQRVEPVPLQDLAKEKEGGRKGGCGIGLYERKFATPLFIRV
jgi:hypothetical protein